MTKPAKRSTRAKPGTYKLFENQQKAIEQVQQHFTQKTASTAIRPNRCPSTYHNNPNPPKTKG